MGTDQCQAERSRRLQCSHLPVRLGKVGDGQPLEFVGEEPALLGGELVNSAHTELQSDRGRCAHQFLVEPPQRAHTHVDSRCPHCRDLFGPVSRRRDGPVALAHQPVAPCPARKGTIPFAYPMARGEAGQDTGPFFRLAWVAASPGARTGCPTFVKPIRTPSRPTKRPFGSGPRSPLCSWLPPACAIASQHQLQMAAIEAGDVPVQVDRRTIEQGGDDTQQTDLAAL